MVGRPAGPPEETLPRRRIFVRGGGRARGDGGGGGWFKRVLAALLLVVLVLPAVQVAFHRAVPVWITPLQVQRFVEGHGMTREWTPLEDISPELIRAVIASEDAQFCAHWGFDFREIRNAFREWQSGERIRGASTISMQTARNVFLWAGRDPVRKMLEAYLTPWIEAGWSKKRIMEVYLNVIEWGPGLYGAEAAAQRYFDKPAADLTRREASLLAAVLPGPLQWSPADPTAYLQRRAGTIRARIPSAPTPGEENDPCPVK
ncbi:monofunctional biosynthetic peptidoglycan transglycosylase [Caenispirillum salinarum]|uniref:monofunctional biosynthetic peptidoglycan transglycosylase n=1 Tax=Caenispirillum salinarum TaxID=859058 RepID=UPI00384A7F35